MLLLSVLKVRSGERQLKFKYLINFTQKYVYIFFVIIMILYVLTLHF